jgi:hypothetical protein
VGKGALFARRAHHFTSMKIGGGHAIGSRECAPDDGEAIHGCKKEWIASSQVLLAMT